MPSGTYPFKLAGSGAEIPLPYTMPNTADVIDYEVEEQFASYLKKKSFEESGVMLIP